MKQWEIHQFPFRVEQVHPAVVLSTDERCQNPDIGEVNVLLCTSARVNRQPKGHEVILDEADGLDWKTAVRCDVIYLVRKEEFLRRRGLVTHPRRVEITRAIIENLRLPRF